MNIWPKNWICKIIKETTRNARVTRILLEIVALQTSIKNIEQKIYGIHVALQTSINYIEQKVWYKCWTLECWTLLPVYDSQEDLEVSK